MKNSIYLFLTIICFSSTSLAQPNDDHEAWGELSPYCVADQTAHHRLNKSRETYRLKKVKEVSTLKHQFDGDSNLVSTRLSSKSSVDKNGLITRTQVYDRKGHITYTAIYSYDDQDRLNKIVSWPTGVIGYDTSVTYFSYHSDSLFKERIYEERGMRGRRKGTRYQFRYDDQDRLLETKKEVFKRSKEWLISRTEIDYFEDGKRKAIRYFNKRNKLKHEVRFEPQADPSVRTKTSQTDTLASGLIQRTERIQVSSGRSLKKVIQWEPEGNWHKVMHYDAKGRLKKSSIYEIRGKTDIYSIDGYYKIIFLRIPIHYSKVSKTNSFGDIEAWENHNFRDPTYTSYQYSFY